MTYRIKLKKDFKISELKKDYNMYFHKDNRIWGVGEPNQKTEYALLIAYREIVYNEEMYKKHKQFIDNFIKDLENRGYLEENQSEDNNVYHLVM